MRDVFRDLLTELPVGGDRFEQIAFIDQALASAQLVADRAGHVMCDDEE
jgi:hypothetical protein